MPPTIVSAEEFDFIGERGSLKDGWNDPGRAALWTYNLHYFDDLRRLGWRTRADWHRTLIFRWIAENPPVAGMGWDAFPVSLRIVNWIVWDLAGGNLPEEARTSLANQAEWLSRNLETHLLGNHLFANLKALVFAGCYFEGAAADRWLGTALSRLGAELDEQVLADGGHFELTPMYHAIFLADLLDLVNLARTFPGRLPSALDVRLQEAAGRMLGWLATMSHPDGEIALFNDAAFGIAPNVAQLAAYGAALAVGTQTVGRSVVGKGVVAQQLPDSGYVRLQAEEAVAICDVARIGPDFLPGHAHADTLSYELSVGGRRIVVNGGTSRYGTDTARVQERSTASHSTVEVAGLPSSEVWSGFRVARRAKPFDISLEPVPGGIQLSGSHDGYARLAGAPSHKRTWTMGPDELRVQDTVQGGRYQAVARHILHPDVARSWPDDVAYRTNEPSELRPARHAPYFGRSLDTQAITVALIDGEAEIRWSWR